MNVSALYSATGSGLSLSLSTDKQFGVLVCVCMCKGQKGVSNKTGGCKEKEGRSLPDYGTLQQSPAQSRQTCIDYAAWSTHDLCVGDAAFRGRLDALDVLVQGA